VNMKAGIPKFSLALVLIGLTLGGIKGNPILIYVLAAVLILDGIVMTFENKKPRPIPAPRWKTLVDSAKDLDMTWIAFGLGMVNLSTTLLGNSLILPGTLLLISGVLLVGWNSGQLIGRGGARLLSQNAKVGIILGSIMLVGGAIWLVLAWNTGDTRTIMLQLNNVVVQIVIVCVGIMFISFGCRKLSKLRGSESQQRQTKIR
jgi:hypothetical protein